MALSLQVSLLIETLRLADLEGRNRPSSRRGIHWTEWQEPDQTLNCRHERYRLSKLPTRVQKKMGLYQLSGKILPSVARKKPLRPVDGRLKR